MDLGDGRPEAEIFLYGSKIRSTDFWSNKNFLKNFFSSDVPTEVGRNIEYFNGRALVWKYKVYWIDSILILLDSPNSYHDWRSWRKFSIWQRTQPQSNPLQLLMESKYIVRKSLWPFNLKIFWVRFGTNTCAHRFCNTLTPENVLQKEINFRLYSTPKFWFLTPKKWHSYRLTFVKFTPKLKLQLNEFSAAPREDGWCGSQGFH